MKQYYYRDKYLKEHKISVLKLYLYPCLIIFFISSSLGFTSAIKFNTFVEKIPVIIKTNQLSFNEDNLKKEIQRLHIRFPSIVLAQSKLETGNYTSPIFLQNNNLFGMKCAQTRATTNTGENLNHAKYNTWQESLLDYSLWQESFTRDLNTEEEYLQFLDKYYAEGMNYSNKLKQLK